MSDSQKNEVAVPVLLVLQPTDQPVLTTQPFHIVAKADHGEVISRQGEMGVNVEVAIVDTRNVVRQDAIVASLFLRNAGLTVIIGDVMKVPTDLVQDLHSFTIDAKSRGESVRTETLVMEDAMDLYGDITDVVRYFEETFL